MVQQNKYTISQFQFFCSCIAVLWPI